MRVALALSDIPPPTDASNVQVRVWTGRPRELVFDRTVQACSVPQIMHEFARHQLTPVPAPDESALSEIAALGGPFDSDHALLRASVRPRHAFRGHD